MPRTIEVEIDLDDFNDYEVLEYTYNLIKNDRDKRDYLSNFIYNYKDNINISVFFNKMNQNNLNHFLIIKN